MKEDQQIKNKKSNLPKYLFVVLLGALALSYFIFPPVREFLQEAWEVLTSEDEKRIKNWVSQFGFFGPMVVIMAMILQMFLIVIPSIALIVISILAYGPFWGSALAFIAVGISSSVGFFLGKHLGHKLVVKMIGQKSEEKVKKFIENYGFWAVVVTRINPFLSNDAISFVGGMLHMTFKKFLSATFLGITPLIVLIAILGESNEGLKKGLLWGSLISLAGLIIYIFLNQKKKNP